MKPLHEMRVAVVGVGLMGGSLAGALRGQCRSITGVDSDPATVEAAQALGLVDAATTDLAEGVAEADLVVLAAPVRAILDLLLEVGRLVRPGTLVFDLGSTKARVAAAMARLPEPIELLGGHPMCGRELSGVTAADPDLFRERTFILCPLDRTSPEALDLGRALVAAVGAHPLVIAPERQDFLAATVSHLPYLLACALVGTADATTSADPLVWEMAASGFRSTSRLAGSDVTMMLDILLTNREEVLAAAATYRESLDALMALIEAGDETALRAEFARLRATRLEMFP